MKNNVLSKIFIYIVSFFMICNIYFTYHLLRNKQEQFASFLIILNSCFFIFCIFIFSKILQKRFNQIFLIPIRAERHHHILNHYFLPLLFLLILPIFWSFYNFDFVIIISSVFSYFLLIALFYNLNYFYIHNFKLEAKTHIVYDMINICVFILVNIVVFNIFTYTIPTILFKVLSIVVINSLFYLFVMTRYFTKLIRKVFFIGIIFIVLDLFVIVLFNNDLFRSLIFLSGTFVNFLLSNRKYFANEYIYYKKDYKEILIYQFIIFLFLLFF